MSFCAKPKAKSQNLIPKKISLSHGRGEPLQTVVEGLKPLAFPNSLSALTGNFSLGEKGYN